jgi:hypothetical protein
MAARCRQSPKRQVILSRKNATTLAMLTTQFTITSCKTSPGCSLGCLTPTTNLLSTFWSHQPLQARSLKLMPFV